MRLQVFGIICVLIFSEIVRSTGPQCLDPGVFGQIMAINQTIEKNCSLKVGESTVIQESYSDSPTSNRRNFGIMKMNSLTYKIFLNLNFVRSSEGNPGVVSATGESGKNESANPSASEIFKSGTDAEFQSYFSKKVSDCLSQSSKMMVGPGGEKIQFELTDSDKAPQSNRIRVIASDIRDNSARYSLYTTCETITHEVLHLLGLVDEYQEHVVGYVVNQRGDTVLGDMLGGTEYAFNCRALGPLNSVMSNEQQAFADVKSGIKKSLLTPGQFRMITSPRCATVNSTYLSCAKNAYRTSKDRNGLGCLSADTKCSKNDGSWLQ